MFQLDVYAKCKYLLEKVKTYCPQHYIDGITNTWIIKPTSNCSGHGIMLSRDLQTIKQIITEADVLKNNYILQKYIGNNNYCISKYRYNTIKIIFIFRKTPSDTYM